jgi:hypothetical protein
MKTLSLCFMFVALTLSLPATAEWTAGDLTALEQAFVSEIAASYNTTDYPWQFLTDCTAIDCFGTDPAVTYGAPNFYTDIPATRPLLSTGALVLIMETPPPMRYFGITPYIFYRNYPNHIRFNPATPGVISVFESLTDTDNLDTIGSAGSPVPGTSPFTQLSVFVITADKNTYSDIVNQFVALGFPDYGINQIALPINAVPLNMGESPTSDTYTVLLRMAYPNDFAQMTDYINRAPIQVLYLTPAAPRTVSALPTPISRVPGDGQSEPRNLRSARNSLVNDLQARFGNDYTISETRYLPIQTNNYVCVTYGLVCSGDNPDALYTRDINNYVPSSPQDRILIVGVNHVSTHKATYLSHSVVNSNNRSGVIGVSDSWLNGTALTMAGITDPNDPRYATYQQLYAFTISYDCEGDPTCLTIPQPTITDPNGVQYGDPFDVNGRIYLDPTTYTRPSTNEIYFHRVFIMTRK